MVETMYEPEGRAPNGEPFLTVKRVNGWYEYSERPGVDSIAFILHDNDTGLYGLVLEHKPPRYETTGFEVQAVTAFGGSMDSDKSHLQTCIQEVCEEAGYMVMEQQVKSCGTTMVSTQSSQMCHLYLVDVTGCTAGPKSEEDQDLRIIWMTKDHVLQNNDWKAVFIVAKS